MAEPKLVTIGIPAYNAADLLAAVVDTAMKQDYPNIRVLVSVDLSDDGTGDLARELAALHGLDLIVQPKRLGWIGNSNAVLNAMKSPFGMILPHDDFLHPSYVSRCMTALEMNDAASVACSDLQDMNGGGVMRQMELRGVKAERASRCIADAFDAVSYRGVIRFRNLPNREVPMAFGGFAADTLWMLRMAIAGEVIRVPEVLYRKNFHERSTHRAWFQMNSMSIDQRWLAHVAEMELLILRDAPFLLLDGRIGQALRTRAKRLGKANFVNQAPLGGWTERLPLMQARIEYLRHALRALGAALPNRHENRSQVGR